MRFAARTPLRRSTSSFFRFDSIASLSMRLDLLLHRPKGDVRDDARAQHEALLRPRSTSRMRESSSVAGDPLPSSSPETVNIRLHSRKGRRPGLVFGWRRETRPGSKPNAAPDTFPARGSRSREDIDPSIEIFLGLGRVDAPPWGASPRSLSNALTVHHEALRRGIHRFVRAYEVRRVRVREEGGLERCWSESKKAAGGKDARRSERRTAGRRTNENQGKKWACDTFVSHPLRVRASGRRCDTWIEDGKKALGAHLDALPPPIRQRRGNLDAGGVSRRRKPTEADGSERTRSRPSRWPSPRTTRRTTKPTRPTRTGSRSPRTTG